MENSHQIISSILDVLHHTFNDAFLIRGMDMVFQLWEPACLWVPCFTVSRNRVFPMSFQRQDRKRASTNLFLSLDMLTYCENFLVGRLRNCHPSKPYQLNQFQIMHRQRQKLLINLLFLWGKPLWFVILYPVPDGNMVSFGKLWGQYLGGSS